MMRAQSMGVGLLGVTLALSANVHAQAREVPPFSGYHLESQVRSGLVIGGAITFALPYALDIGRAVSNKRDGDRWLFVPVLGPFLDVAMRSQCKGEGCWVEPYDRFFLYLDGATQIGGATMLICGFAFPRHVLVPDQESPGPSSRTITWTVEPRSVGRSGFGLGVSGTF